jgi:hypothetical protein
MRNTHLKKLCGIDGPEIERPSLLTLIGTGDSMAKGLMDNCMPVSLHFVIGNEVLAADAMLNKKGGTGHHHPSRTRAQGPGSA